MKFHARATTVCLIVGSAAIGVLLWSMTVGDYSVEVSHLWAAASGSTDRAIDSFIVGEVRLPRSILSLVVGAAFAISGFLLQRLTRNPLASPDVIGINSGAAAGAVAAIIVTGAGPTMVTVAAALGAAATAAAITALASRNGIGTNRLVLIGIGIGALCTAVTQFLLTRADIHDAQRATVWMIGNLNGRGWDVVGPSTLALITLIAPALVMNRRLNALELGDDLGVGLGLAMPRTYYSVLAVSVGLAATATAAAGPIGFVALVAPQIARRLVGPHSSGLIASAAVGALLLAASDLIARRLFAPIELPVGVVTGMLGGPYLLVLLARSRSRA